MLSLSTLHLFIYVLFNFMVLSTLVSRKLDYLSTVKKYIDLKLGNNWLSNFCSCSCVLSPKFCPILIPNINLSLSLLLMLYYHNICTPLYMCIYIYIHLFIIDYHPYVRNILFFLSQIESPHLILYFDNSFF